MTRLPDINLLTSRQLEEILKTCDSYLGKKLGLEGSSDNLKLPVIISGLNLSWKSVDDFEGDINIFTGEKNIRSAYAKLYTLWEQKLHQEKSEKVERTTPTKESLKSSEEERVKREKILRESEVKGKVQTEKFIKSQKVYLEAKEKTQEITLTEQENIALGKLIQSAESDPKTFVAEMAQEISNKTGADPESCQVAALDFYTKINSKTTDVPPSAFLAVASSQKDPEIIEASLSFAQLYELKNKELRSLIQPVLGEKIIQVFYPLGNQEFNVTNEKTDKSEYEIDLGQLQSDFRNFQDSPVLDQIKNQGKSVIKEWVANKIESLPAQSAFKGFVSRIKSSQLFKQALPFLGMAPTTEVVTTSFVGKTINFLFPQFAPKIAQVATRLGIDLGIRATATVAAGTTGTTAAKALGANLGKVAAGALAKIGISIPASFIPGLNIALWAITIISILKDLKNFIQQFGPKIKQWLSDNAHWLVGIGAAGLLFRNPIINVLGITSISAGILSGASFAKIAGRTAFFFARLGASMAVTIGTPIIITIIVFPILVAIILFIINSGAYVVPPKSSTSIPGECMGDVAVKPEATGIMFSPDNKYAYPVAPSGSTGESCTHWDKSLATDIFPANKHAPVIAYTSGSIEGISLTDSKGGKYVILAGNDGRYYYYAHNCALFVKEGDAVFAGDVIATTDQSGSANGTAEHLHFAISSAPNFVNGGTVCPSQDFADKFPDYNKCKPEEMCIP